MRPFFFVKTDRNLTQEAENDRQKPSEKKNHGATGSMASSMMIKHKN